MCDVSHFNKCVINIAIFIVEFKEETCESESLGRHHRLEADDLDLNSICLSQKFKPLPGCVLMPSASA